MALTRLRRVLLLHADEKTHSTVSFALRTRNLDVFSVESVEHAILALKCEGQFDALVMDPVSAEDAELQRVSRELAPNMLRVVHCTKQQQATGKLFEQGVPPTRTMTALFTVLLAGKRNNAKTGPK